MVEFKKYKVYNIHEPNRYVILLSETRDKAKSVGMRYLGYKGLDYLDIRADRCKEDNDGEK